MLAVWVVVVCLAAAGLGRYRVENSLRDWAPQLAGHDAVPGYVVIGGVKDAFDIDQLSRRLGSLDEVAFCVSPGAAQRFAPWVSAVTLNTAFSDPDYTGLFCFAPAGVSDARLLDAIKAVIDTQPGGLGGHLAVGGPAVFTAALTDWSQRRMPLISMMIVLVGAVMLRWVVGSTRVALAATSAIVGSQVALVGVISWLGVPMDMVLSMVWPLMMALGFSFAAHRALRPGVSGTLALCAATTAGGIGVFVFCQFPPIRSFAIWGAVGLFMTWGSVMLLIQPTRRPGGIAKPHRGVWCSLRLATCAIAIGRPKTVVAVAAAVTLLAIACVPSLQLQNDPIRYFPKDSQVRSDYEQLNDRLVGMLPFEVQVNGDADATALLASTPGVSLLADVSLMAPQAGSLYLGLADSGALPSLVDAQKDWQRWAKDRGVELVWSGVAAQLHGVSLGVIRVAVASFPAMVLIAGLATWYVGGPDPRLVFIGAAVNLFPIAVAVVVVTLLGWRLSLPSLVIAAIAVGAAIDDTLHIVAAHRQERDIRRTMSSCWRPCVGSSLITAACMLLFVMSPFRPTAEFGVLMALTATAALIGDVLLLPALLQLSTRRR
jgi:hypothetical protein